MIWRVAMILGFPVLAIAGAFGIAYGVLVVGPRMGAESRAAVYDAAHPEVRQTQHDLDVALTTVLGSVGDLATELRPTSDSHGWTGKNESTDTKFEASTAFGPERGHHWSGSATLHVDHPDTAQRERVPHRGWKQPGLVTLAEGFIGADHRDARSWRVTCVRTRERPGVTRDLEGACCYDGVWLEVDLRGDATSERVAAFQRLIEAAAGRLPAICAGQLAPYVKRANAATPESR